MKFAFANAALLATPCRRTASLTLRRSAFAAPLPCTRRTAARPLARTRIDAVAAPPVPAKAPEGVALLAPPPGAYDAAVATGAGKAKVGVLRVLLLGIAAGAYIAIGGLMALSVGGSSPGLAAANPGLYRFLMGAIGLPFGMTLVMATGSELFLGNIMLLSAAAFRKKATWMRVFSNWTLVYLANFIGALAIVGLALGSQVVTPLAAAAAATLAKAKCSLPFGVMFLRGFGCNFLVSSGVYVASGARDFTSKFIVAFTVVSTFVTLGFDNSVTNMFFIPLGMACGADVSVKSFLLANLLPVSLGNLVAGVVFVSFLFGFAHEKKKVVEVPLKSMDHAALVAATRPPTAVAVTQNSVVQS